MRPLAQIAPDWRPSPAWRVGEGPGPEGHGWRGCLRDRRSSLGFAAMKLRRRDILAGRCAASSRCGASARPRQQLLILNDASRLNPTVVGRRASVRSPPEPRHRGAARRTQGRKGGGQGRVHRWGAAFHGRSRACRPAEADARSISPAPRRDRQRGEVYRVSGGARWREVIAALDPAGLSPAVAQSSNDFAVGARGRVNAHGWPAPRGPGGFHRAVADGDDGRRRGDRLFAGEGS